MNKQKTEEAREAFEKHHEKLFSLGRAEWGDGYAFDGVDAMWIGWRNCWERYVAGKGAEDAA